MKTPANLTFNPSLALIVALCLSADSLAQTEEEDQELEVITIEQHYEEADDESQEYRLI